MVDKIIFQSSLPRSGSTLLQNIMGQNPDIYSTPTSGLMELIFGAKHNFTNVDEYKYSLIPEIHDKAFSQFCNSAIHGYANVMTDRKYFLDKGRSWIFYIRWIEHFLPYKPKMICMVRDLRDVFCSMEKAFRKNPNQETLVDWSTLKNNTVAKRIDTWANGIPVGIAIERLESVIQCKDDHKILFVRYEDFCLNPEQQIARIYNYLEIPFFQHNFDYIPQITHENDSPHMGYGDHTIRNTLQMKPSDAQEILGKGVCDWIYGRYKWFYDYFKY